MVSKSSRLRPDRSQSLCVAWTGPTPIFWGSQPTAAQDDPAAVAAGSEAVADAGDCVARLAPDERLSLLGPLLHGLTFRAAAALHGLSLGQFKHRYETALERVRECMKRKGHDFP